VAARLFLFHVYRAIGGFKNVTLHVVEQVPIEMPRTQLGPRLDGSTDDTGEPGAMP